MTTHSLDRTGLASMTIRELLAELTRLEDRLNSQRAATGYQVTPENARLERRMRAISAHLRERRNNDVTTAAPPTPEADEADRLEQSLPVESDPDEDYPHEQEVPPPA